MDFAICSLNIIIVIFRPLKSNFHKEAYMLDGYLWNDVEKLYSEYAQQFSESILYIHCGSFFF